MLVVWRLTIPCIKHVRYEVVYKGNLGLWDATCVPVKHRHNHWQTLPLLLIRLQQGQEQMNLTWVTNKLFTYKTVQWSPISFHLCKILLWDASGPFYTELLRPAWIRDIGTFNQHPLDEDSILRGRQNTFDRFLVIVALKPRRKKH